jgi:TrmH family RNA methyltransferase
MLALSCSAILLRKVVFPYQVAKMLPLKKDIKLVRSLHQKKFRNLNGLFFVEGLKMVQEALVSSFRVHSLYSTQDDFCSKHNGCIKVSEKEMEQLSALSSPSAHIVVLYQKAQPIPTISGSTLLVLDGISDPGNMGTIMRTAEWFGIKQLLCTPECVEVYNPKVVQSTMGSIFRVETAYLDVQSLVSTLRSKGYVLIGAEMNGTDLYEFDFPSKRAIVIGSESHGLNEEMKQALSNSITIPGHGKAESLNASIAASIILAESFRQGR